MSRSKPSHRRRPGPPSPHPSQLRAVDRLLAQGRLEEVESRLEDLLAQFPNISAVRSRYVALLERIGALDEATLATLAWTRAVPGSLEAWRHAAECLAGQGLELLANDARTKVNALQAASEAALPILSADALESWRLAHGNPGWDELRRVEEASLLTESCRYDDVIELLDGAEHPTSALCRARALFHLGEIDSAEREIQTAVEGGDDPGACAWQVRLCLWRGDADRARISAQRLATLEAYHITQAREQAVGLMFAQDFGAARGVLANALERDWFVRAPALARGRLLHVAASCAWWLGEVDEARVLLESALAIANLTLLAEELQGFKQPPRSYAGPGFLWGEEIVPEKWWWELHDLGHVEGFSEADLDDAEAGIYAGIASIYFSRAHALGTASGMDLAQTALMKRAASGDPEARALVLALLADWRGTSRNRMHAVGFLARAGMLKRGDEVSVFDGEKVRVYTVPLPDVAEACDVVVTSEDDRQAIVRLSGLLHDHNQADIERALKRVRALSEASGGEHDRVLDVLEEDAHNLESLRQKCADSTDWTARIALAVGQLDAGHAEVAEALAPDLVHTSSLTARDIIGAYGLEARLLDRRGEHEAAEDLLFVLRGFVRGEQEEDLWHEVAQPVLHHECTHVPPSVPGRPESRQRAAEL